ncbi:hypothetical protein Tco_0536907 [Tanacetum coccineum]
MKHKIITFSGWTLKRDLITLRIVPRLWSSGPSSASNVFRRETICTKLSTLVALKGLIPKDSGAITLSFVHINDSLEQAAVSLPNHAQQEDHAFQITLLALSISVVYRELALDKKDFDNPKPFSVQCGKTSLA